MSCREVRFRVCIINKRTYKKMRIYVVLPTIYVGEAYEIKLVITERVQKEKKLIWLGRRKIFFQSAQLESFKKN